MALITSFELGGASAVQSRSLGLTIVAQDPAVMMRLGGMSCARRCACPRRIWSRGRAGLGFMSWITSLATSDCRHRSPC